MKIFIDTANIEEIKEAASIRNPLHVLDATRIGADIATIPFKVCQQLIKHPLTDFGLEKFLEDYKAIPQN